MIYKKVDRIKEEISVVGLGCWNFGGDWDNTMDQKSIDIVHKSIELGINFFDVAPVYGLGNSEIVLGKALKGKRDKVIIASKGGLLWNDKNEVTNNLSKASLLKEVDESLSRLGTDYIDIYQMHWPDPNTALEETAEALRILKASGKIRYIGISNFSKEDALNMHDYVGVDCQQSLYNMFERNTASYHSIPLEYKTEDEILPMVNKLGQAFLPYSPLFQGLLAGKFNKGITFSKDDIRNANPKLVGPDFKIYFDAALQLKELADKYNKPMNEIALNWLVQKPEVTSIIGGASTVTQIEQNIHCTTWKINDEMMKEIDTIIKPFETL